MLKGVVVVVVSNTALLCIVNTAHEEEVSHQAGVHEATRCTNSCFEKWASYSGLATNELLTIRISHNLSETPSWGTSPEDTLQDPASLVLYDCYWDNFNDNETTLRRPSYPRVSFCKLYVPPATDSRPKQVMFSLQLSLVGFIKQLKGIIENIPPKRI